MKLKITAILLLATLSIDISATHLFDQLKNNVKAPKENPAGQRNASPAQNASNGSGAAASIADAQGWLGAITVSQVNLLLAEAISGKKERVLGINLHVVGLSSASGGPINCALFILDETEPYALGAPQNTLKSKSLQQKYDKASPYANGHFVKFEQLKVLHHANQSFCIAHSINPQASITPSVARFDAKTHFIGTLFEKSERIPALEPHYKWVHAPGSPSTYAPVHYGCTKFKWPSDEHATATRGQFDQYIQSHSLEQFANSGVQLSGITPLNENGMCVFESIQILASNKADQTEANTPHKPAAENVRNEKSQHSNDYIDIPYIIVTDLKIEKSYLDKCKEKVLPENFELQCGSMTGYLNTSPTLHFKIPEDETKRINAFGRNFSPTRGYSAKWKEGIEPTNIEALQNLKNQRVKLINTSLFKRDVLSRQPFLFEEAVIEK